MKLFKIFFVFFLFFHLLDLQGQVLLSEGFETGNKPDGWTEEAASGNEPWRYRNGGHSPNDNNWQVPPEQVDITRNPPAAFEGSYNAIFFKQGDNNERTKLITPPMDLLGAAALELTFQLCQVPWTFEGATGWDVLRIYYKRAVNDPWILLEEYLDPIYEWEEQKLNLPNPSDEYYIAFEGHTRWGFGTCIDAITVEETGSQTLYIGETEFQQPFPNIIPSGSPDVPMMIIDLKVFGNTGTLSMDQITFSSLNTDDGDVLSAGVKLWTTGTQSFDRDTPLGSATDFSGGSASFSGLSHNLEAGHNYLWLTYDVALDAKHQNTLDLQVLANAISAGGSTYPATVQNPDGYRLVYETRYQEGFEGAHNWTLSGEFEVGTPNGMGADPGNGNPDQAFRGSLSLGTDLSGQGTFPYKYEPGISEEAAWTATSPAIDMLYFKNLKLFFQRYLNIEVWDKVAIEISADGGTNWSVLWENNSYLSDFQWIQTQLDISDQYARKDQLMFRYRLGPTDGFQNYTGWNIDEFYLTGEFISKDVGISQWVYPQSGSGHTSNDSVTVLIRNYGGAEITDPVPVAYSFDGGVSWTVDQMNQSIPVGGEISFTFPTRTDLSQPGLRPSVLARTILPGDQFSGNDQLETEIYVVPTYVPPYLEDFELGDGYWRSEGNGLWEHGEPAGTLIDRAASGNQSWVTSLSGSYGDALTQQAQIIFDEDFETDHGWSFSGKFQRETPSNIYVPYFAYSGFYCLGTGLSGLDPSDYLYENNITPASAYTATSPALDVSQYSNLYLSIASWANVLAGDSIRIELSTDNGSSWTTFWKNSGAISDYAFELHEYSIPDSYSQTTQLRIRFSLFYSDASGVETGWNIDDLLLQGDLANQAPAWLDSPSFDLSSMLNPVLDAMIWVDTEEDIDGSMLQYSLDDGQSWTDIGNASGYDSYWNWYTGSPVAALGHNGWSGQSGDWMQTRHLLPPALAGESNVQFRFVFMNDKANNNFEGIALDDLRVIEAPADLDMVQILGPGSACELGDQQSFQLRMHNSSLHDLQSGDSLKVGYLIERDGDIQTSTETYILSQSWPSGSNLDLNMLETFDFSHSGFYESTVYLISEDPYFYSALTNDTASMQIEVNKPHVDLGGDISTARPDTVLLKAYSGVPGQTYLWQDASTDSVFAVTGTGTYWVRVSNLLGCTTSDTAHVLQLVPDVGVSTHLGPDPACEIPDPVALRVRVENLGTDTVMTGVSIFVSGQINAGTVFSDEVILAQPFRPGESFVHDFGLQDFSVPMDYQIKTWTQMLDDLTTENDTLLHTLTVHGYPDASLGNDVVVDAASYLLAPESGHAEYLWQDGSTGESFLVEEEGIGLYHVWIRNDFGCESADTVVVTLNVTDLELAELLSPSTSCELSESITIEARIRNVGNQAIASGEIIPMAYQIDGGAVVQADHTLTQDLLPGHELDFTFPQSETVVTGQWYDFTVFVDYSQDMIEHNDTIETSVGVFETPLLDLGPDYQVIVGLDYLLDAGSGFVSYLWQDASTEQTFLINEPGIAEYHVTVSDVNGCIVADTVTIMLSVPDAGISHMQTPQNSCSLGLEEYIEVAVKNYGIAPIEASEEVWVHYSVNGSEAFSERLQLSEDLDYDDTVFHRFSQPWDMSVPGTYDIIAWTTWDKDLVAGNDDILVSIQHWGSPLVDIGMGSDSLVLSGPATLYAIPGYASYLWQDGSTETEYEISDYSAGWFWVEVTAENACTAVDSVHVIYDYPDLALSAVLSPLNSCSVAGGSNIVMEITNQGYYRIGTTDTLVISYQVTGGSSDLQEILLDQELQPGASVALSFDDPVDFSATGDYEIEMNLEWDNDQVLANNQRTQNFSIWENPVFELAGGADTLVGSLPMTVDAGSGFQGYLWQDGSTGQTIEAAQVGWYRVAVSNSFGCTASDSVYVNTLTSSRSISELESLMQVYPNPVKETLFLKTDPKLTGRFQIELWSMAGVLVKQVELEAGHGTDMSVDVQELNPGAYVMRAIQGEQAAYFRILVE